ncbi:MAG: ABC transporter substrate-binding protein [Pseudomonadota bacterium]
MRIKTAFMTGIAAATLAATPASAETLTFAFQGPLNSLDPHSLNETFQLGFLGNIYEGLTRRGPDLAIQPALAESWEIVEPNRWRFNLRQDVTFHNGNPFTADDVVFSYERATSEGSDVGGKLPGVVAVERIDDHTVDFVTDGPNPILTAEFDTWYIMDQEWAIENGADEVTNVAESDREFYANRNANGTNAFMIQEHQSDVRTVAVPNPDWWDEPVGNLTEVVFQPITSDSTRVAALLSGEMDLVYPVPLQDQERVDSNDGTNVLAGPELRTIFLGMDQSRDELLYSDIEGANPFQDRDVRLAFYQAIDIDAIQQVVMRGASTPSAAMVAPGINGYPANLERYPYDPDAARALLEEAGYGDGFEVQMNCPNDRYVNDEAICQAIVGMLDRIGVTVNLLAEPRSVYFGRVLAQGGYDTSFYLLGWSPGSIDSYNPLFNLTQTRNPDTGSGTFNLGGYSDSVIDDLTNQVLVETDQDARGDLINQAWLRLHEEVGYLPLHQQALSWGVRDGVDVSQRADNVFRWQYTTISN